MKIILAKNIGFCFGVKRAISIAKASLKEKIRPVQFLGSLVHNKNVVEKFLKKGVIFKKKIKEIKPGILIIQAHGFPPFPKNFGRAKLSFGNKILIRDATCPLVKKVQMLANSLWEQGYQVIIIGDQHHSEVKGIKGYTKNKAIIVENKKEAEKLPKFKRVAVVAQTTQDLNNINEILKVLKRKYKKVNLVRNRGTLNLVRKSSISYGVKYFNTICPEVQVRQKEVKSIAKKADEILVIGSKSSANTKRLYQISKTSGKPIWWVNSLKELKKQKINNSIVLGLLSGTSVDNSEIEKIKKYLKQL